ncbi:MAG: hypothetical protein NW224_19735 [Leptolyngbyaceae cyanobacterium bins.302]|nr:hypothetical protein [Leptolyngbyaceae cyanobacterium bins.302]
MAMNHQEKIITLWIVFLLGTLFHTQIGLMPLFHSQNIAISDSHGTEHIAWILWLMLGFFVVPMLVMIVPLFDESKRYRKLHFGTMIFYSVMNLFHIIAQATTRPSSTFLM